MVHFHQEDIKIIFTLMIGHKIHEQKLKKNLTLLSQRLLELNFLIIKNIKNLDNAINHLNLHIYRTLLYPTIIEKAFFSNSHGTFTR